MFFTLHGSCYAYIVYFTSNASMSVSFIYEREDFAMHLTFVWIPCMLQFDLCFLILNQTVWLHCRKGNLASVNCQNCHFEAHLENIAVISIL